METALAVAVMVDVSVAEMPTSTPASTPPFRVVSMYALTTTLTLFSMITPAPEAAMAIAPIESEADCDEMSAVIVAPSVALIVSELPAFALAFLRYASTWAACALPVEV